jgi:protocatechuate 3,4-dioxygenase beta subunit
LVGTTETDADGRYSFDKYATYDGYRVSLMRPTGLTSDGPLSKTVDLSTSDQVADFTLRAVAGVSAAGTVRDPDGNPVPGVTVTLHEPNTGATTTQITDGDGNYLFDPVAAGSG